MVVSLFSNEKPEAEPAAPPALPPHSLRTRVSEAMTKSTLHTGATKGLDQPRECVSVTLLRNGAIGARR